jgi:hypothetical protein
MSSMATTPAAPQKQGGFRRIWRALHQLFLEVMGALFAVLAFAWLNAAVRTWSRDAAHWMTGLTVGVALVFTFFALTSFRRARKMK